ncbi:hypothetical protein JKP88DRAFT_227662 [Tribonema minus]|uniref:Uncharacterized protein n=1 Tax=Tribonema minus TaxID=303371 RepID=A0A835YU80_9STRA|nr:hypothetical protein JKP88DRAFT_227662 [Tribonema minus]
MPTTSAVPANTTGTTTNRHNASSTAKKGVGYMTTLILGPLLIVLFVVMLGLCASVMNSYINGDIRALIIVANPACLLLVILTLISSTVALAVVISTMMIHSSHQKLGYNSPRFTSMSTILPAFALLALAFGFACKALASSIPNGSSSLGKQTKAIAALMISTTIEFLVYTLIMMADKPKYAPGYAGAGHHNTSMMTGHKDIESGAPVA